MRTIGFLIYLIKSDCYFEVSVGNCKPCIQGIRAGRGSEIETQGA